MKFKDRPLSSRLGRAMYWKDIDFEERLKIIEQLAKLPLNPEDADLPKNIRDLLEWAESVADEKEPRTNAKET
jgi:hypothetical protein